MNHFLFIILTAGLVATSVANSMPEAVILKGQSVKDVAQDRSLKGEKKSMTTTKKSAKKNCPPVKAYVPPALCSNTCYKNVTTLFEDIQDKIDVGIPFEGTLCRGTYTLPVGVHVLGTLANADITLRCCGSKDSCTIDGGRLTSATKREYSVFRFENTVQQFVLEGITFQNFETVTYRTYYEYGYDVNSDVVAILEALYASVVTIRHANFKSISANAALRFFTSALTVEGCSFTDNDNNGEFGVASSFSATSSSVALNGNVFYRNKAYNGGALCFDGGSVVATCNTFEENQVDNFGGAVCGVSDLQFSYNLFKNNISNGQRHAFGGAIYLLGQTMTSFGNTFTTNKAGDRGGGAIYVAEGVLKTTDDIFDSNWLTDFSPEHPFLMLSNIYLERSVLEFKCNSPIRGTGLDDSSVANCI